MLFTKDNSSCKKNVFVLYEDNWDDWFTYETKYYLVYINEHGKTEYIGHLKIGQNPYPEDKKPEIPDEFNELGKEFFSLGQSQDYYKNINRLDQKYGMGLRQKLLTSIRDIAYNDHIYEKVKNYEVTKLSLLRDVSKTTIMGQFRRIANGGATLTSYDFEYHAGGIDEMPPLKMEFNVDPHTKIPTNIHVIIGRNGVGKTYIMKNMIYSLMNLKGEYGSFKFNNESSDITFANIIYVSFSAFDNIGEWYSVGQFEGGDIPFIPVGLDPRLEDTDYHENTINGNRTLEERFAESLNVFSGGYKLDLWKKAIETLSTDPMFNNIKISDILTEQNKVNMEKAKELYSKLSSGHKVIMLTITKLVEKVEEKSLVFIDEPEGHLHPPLLSSFIRTLSELLNNRNGVAIIATHSPVVLQEVPRKCVWKLRRSGRILTAERLMIESFGQSIGELTREVFGLEATNSGYYRILKEVTERKDSFKEVVKHFDNELGIEAMSMIQAILINKDR